jgi:hypothetical protein
MTIMILKTTATIKMISPTAQSNPAPMIMDPAIRTGAAALNGHGRGFIAAQLLGQLGQREVLGIGVGLSQFGHYQCQSVRWYQKDSLIEGERAVILFKL